MSRAGRGYGAAGVAVVALVLGGCSGGESSGRVGLTTGASHAAPDLHCTQVGGLQVGALWPMRGFCGQHRGIGNFQGSVSSEVNWVVSLGFDVRSSAAIAKDGTIYVGSGSNRLHAVRPDGTTKWSTLTGGDVDSSPAIGADGTVYVGSDDNDVYALAWATGEVRWTRATGGDVDSSPAIGADGTVYVGSDDNKLYALAPADGSIVWSYTTGGDVDSSPAIGPGGELYVGSDDDYLYALRPEPGLTQAQRLIWKRSLGGLDVESSPVVGPAPDYFIYVGGESNYLYKLRPSDGAILWSFATVLDVDSSPALLPDGAIVFGDDTGKVRAVNPDKSVKWTRQLGAQVDSSPSVGSDGTVYIGCDDNKVYALDPDDGSVVWSVLTGADVKAAPVIGSLGAIIVGSQDGKLYSIGAAEGAVPEGATPVELDCGNGAGLQAGALSPVQGGCPTRHGVSAQVGSRSTTQSFQQSLGGEIRNAAVIDTEGTAYLGSDSGEVRAVRADGTTKWVVSVGAAVRAVAAIAADGSIYVGADDGRLRKLSGADGSTLWTFVAGGQIRTALVVGESGIVYFGTSGSATDAYYAVDSAGNALWSLPVAGDALAAPVIAKHGLVLVVDGTKLRYLLPQDSLGGMAIPVSMIELGGTPGESSPVLGGADDLFIGRSDGTLVAAYVQGAGVQWTLALPCSGSCALSTPALSPDGARVYVGAANGTLYAVDRIGRLMWSYATGGALQAAPVVDATGVVYVGSSGGKLLALHGRDEMVSRLLWELPLGAPVRASPVIGLAGAIVVGAGDGLLRSIGSHSGSCPAGLSCVQYGPDVTACAEDGILAPFYKTPPACGAGDSCPTGGSCFEMPGGERACHIPCVVGGP